MSAASPFPATWPVPPRRAHEGRHVRLTPLRADEDAAELYQAGHEPAAAREIWRHLWHGPFASEADFRDWLRSVQDGADPLFFTVTQRQTGRRVGMLSIMRITPAHGVAELGHIWYGLAAQRTPVNTESVFLLLRHLFDDLGYRRVEWKCNVENARSRAAALRLGFQFEGRFRQHMVVKGRNRDTAWFAMLDTDWPVRKANFERWLTDEGRTSLSALNGVAASPSEARQLAGKRGFEPGAIKWYRPGMTSAKVFMNGRSQAIRLPKEFRVNSAEVSLKRVPQGILILERDPWEICREACQELSDDFMRERVQPPSQKRDWSKSR